MRRYNAVLVMTLALATPGAALAADLAPSFAPPPPLEAVQAPHDFASGWYLRGDVGIGILESGFRGVNVVTPPGFVEPPGGYVLRSKSFGDQVFVGAGFGYQLNDWIRFDVTGEYRTAASFRATETYSYDGGITTGVNVVNGKISSVVGLANAYFDLATLYGISPFVGVGVGFAHHRTEGFTDEGFGTAVGAFGVSRGESTRSNLAWALHAGLGYHVNPNLKLELAYRYLNMGDARTTVACLCGDLTTAYTFRRMESHDIKLGMRWLFNAPAPMAMASAPLVRKY